jgi:hypothetical protein
MIRELLILCLAAALSSTISASSVNEQYAITASKTTSPENIKIDGQLKEKAWRSALPISGFKKVFAKGKVECQTSIRMFYSDKALYIGIELLEPECSKLAGKGGVIWADDRIEFPLVVDKDAGEYYLFAVNCDGKKEEGCFGSAEYDDEIKDFNVPWEAAVFKDKDRWFVEIRIPFSSLKSKAENGTVWQINFCRQRSPGNLKPVFSAWNPKYNGFHYSGCKIKFK